MKKIIFILLLCKFLYGQNSLGWQQLPQITENVKTLNGLHFFNKDSGWVCGSYRPSSTFQFAAKTNNAGGTWEQYDDIGNLRILNDITFINDSVGFILNGWILKTIDFGKTWIKVFDDFGADVKSRIKFYDEKYGWAIGMDETIVKTSDSGETWEYVTIDSLTMQTLGNLSIVDTNIVYVSNFRSIHKTINSGQTWSVIYKTTGTFEEFYDVEFTSPKKGWIAGTSRRVLFSEDGGENWVDKSPVLSFDAINNLDALDSLTVMAVTSEGAILRTDDGGENWTEQVPQDVFSYLVDVKMIDSLTAYAVGFNGTIVKTTNGGVTWLNETQSNDIPNSFKLYSPYPNPFNPTTTIKFEIPKRGFVNIGVYNTIGQKVQTLLSEEINPGVFELVFNASGLASGVYYISLKSGSFIKSKKILLLR
ncbi:MAG: T9SS C-terminal target domain-containing protein [Calditrichaeota bacterium]|nr:MAG: T9SS C-terminal target domain-containing protein [Calditrichota bacterium]MBL1208032.1 T9SS C-terminal target domain-containing protein [Calditrichota bacterium]NOG47867.1 T9SS type A sorting domain-containing protein [Calditrichota bacterium]